MPTYGPEMVVGRTFRLQEVLMVYQQDPVVGECEHHEQQRYLSMVAKVLLGL
ncbi:hypothetical protein ACCW94_04955 [Enterobacter soli]|uniref:hypothetical protein n=1 Tax=Enterobacter soli TaxID=885040 RepID=UPI003ED9A919